MDKNTIDSNVKSLLKTNAMKNSTSKEFIFAYWKKYDKLGSRINLHTVKRLTDPESITRSRRKVVEKHPSLNPTSLKLITKRRLKEREMRKHYSK
jgi:hypothetical protein